MIDAGPVALVAVIALLSWLSGACLALGLTRWRGGR
jgi:hypothetical protein